MPTKLYSTISSTEEIENSIKAKGDEIRTLKSNGISKEELKPYVNELLAFKQKLASLSPNETTSPTTPPATKKKKPQQQKQKQQKQQSSNNNEEESDYITARSVDYSKWYNDLIRVAGLSESSPVRGCMIIKPWGMSLWNKVKQELDEMITIDHGAENVYFPLLIPLSFLSKEAEHVDGFAKECAVVTHHRLKVDEETGVLGVDKEALLEEPLIIRPTSETMIWNVFRKWIKSYRDLPLKVNQWANVMRWELRTRPFLRTSEFLWQEGHTAHATAEGAITDAKDMLNNYEKLCTDLLAIPVIKGVKSPAERFAGAEDTYTIEGLMQNGWALQCGTSHFLGQNFGTAFDVKYQNEDGGLDVVYGTSWGVSTRLLGALIMTHSDDAGLVLPPKVAPVQIVIVPIVPKKLDDNKKAALEKAIEDLTTQMKKQRLRVKVDDRDYMRPGAKYFEWERKGVPLRIEIGPRDFDNNVCIFKYRSGPNAEEKLTISLDEATTAAVDGLESLQSNLLTSAQERQLSYITRDSTYQEMKEALESDEASTYPGKGFYLVPWKCNTENELKIKEECKATIRCYPLGESVEEGSKCFYSGEDADRMALFARAF